jgi:hypothetical protein
MTVRRIGNYTVSSGTGRVFLINDATFSDSDVSADQAIALGEALLLAARESVRVARFYPNESPCLCGGSAGRATDPFDVEALRIAYRRQS